MRPPRQRRILATAYVWLKVKAFSLECRSAIFSEILVPTLGVGTHVPAAPRPVAVVT
jgi:hypothetical protein